MKILALGLLLFFSLPASAQSREADRDFRFAQETLANDMASTAADLFRAFLEEYPGSAYEERAIYGLARALELEGDSEAIAVYRRYLENYPAAANVPDAIYGIAKAFYNARQWPEARAEFNKFAQLYPNHANIALAKYYEGQTLLKMGRPLEAIPFFKEATDSAAMPLRSEAAFSVAAAYYQANKFTEAAEALSVIADRFRGTPAAAKAEGLTANILYRQGHYAEAIRRYSRALEGNLSYADELMYFRAWSAYKLGDTAAAVRDLILLAEKYPASTRSVEALTFATQIAEASGDTETALRALDIRGSLSPDPAAVAEARFQRARIRYESGDYGGARNEFLEVLGLDKDRADAEYFLGLIEKEEENFPAAESWLRAAEAKSAGTELEENVLLARLDLMKRSSDMAGYQALIRRLEARKSPALARLLREAADMLEAQGSLDDAMKEFAKIISKYPNTPDASYAHYRTGIIHYQAFRYVDAESSLLTFIRMTKDQPQHLSLVDDAWYWVGLSRHQLGKTDASSDAFKEAAAVPGSSTRVPAMLYLGINAQTLKNYQEAIDVYNDVIQAGAEDKEAYFTALYNRADAFRSLGRMDEARAAFLEIYEKGGAEQERALFNAIAVLEESGRETEAMTGYEEAAEKFVSLGRQEEAWMKAGVLRSRLGYPEEAHENFEKILAQGGALASDALYRIGEIWLEQGDTIAALTSFACAAESYPNSVSGRRATLRRAVLEQSAESAIVHLQQLIKAAPGDPASAEARVMLGSIAFSLGRNDSAIAYLKAALESLADGDMLAEAKVILAEAYVNRKMYTQALSQVQYVFRSPLYAQSKWRGDAGVVLGRVLVHLNKKADALKVLNEVVDKYPDLALRAEDVIKRNNLGGS